MGEEFKGEKSLTVALQMHCEQATLTRSTHLKTVLLLNMRFGTLILKEMESQEIHQESQELDCYDDVPEDDDMIVIELSKFLIL